MGIADALFTRNWNSLIQHWISSRNPQEVDTSGFFIRNVRGNQNFDVELKGNELSYIEIASADFDDSELFRMNQFIEHGHVDALSSIERNSKGKPIAIEDKKGMHLHDDLIFKILSLIESRIQKKTKKNYPDNTGLLVYFDDFKYYTKEDDVARFDRLLESTKHEWSQTFKNVSIVGPRAERLFEKWK